MLTFELIEGELEHLKKTIEQSYKDAVYYGKYWEERYSKALIIKISDAITEEQRLKDALDLMDLEGITEELF